MSTPNQADTQLLHKGSVKDIYRHGPGTLMFRFSERYSIFDWGEMPDAIPGKGQALCEMGVRFFEILRAQGVHNHYVSPGTKPSELIVKKVLVPQIAGGAEALAEYYAQKPSQVLIPLEVLYRFGVPEGSSLLKRYPGQYAEKQKFETPLIEFTTKLEKQDRLLKMLEAKRLAGMDDAEFEKLLSQTAKIAVILRDVLQAKGFELWDGKLEFAFDENRTLMLVDSIGLDEMRLTENGVSLSKEILRQHYKQTDWFVALEKAKTLEPVHFKNYCISVLGEAPLPLPPDKIAIVAGLYQKVANALQSEERSL